MSVEIRVASKADVPEMALIDGASFGVSYSEAELEDEFADLDLDRFRLAIDDGVIVGITGDHDLRMTMPGGARLETPGITWVSVRPTHRRRGILTALISEQLHRYRDTGIAVSALTASESGIYGRYGFGVGTRNRTVRIDRQRAQLQAPADGGVRLVDVDEARELIPPIYERWCEQTPGAVTRSERWWERWFKDHDRWRAGASQRRYLVHHDGYVAFRAREKWDEFHPSHSAWVVNYVPVTDRARRALWSVLLGMDLFAEISCDRFPVDDPLPYHLTDPRQVHTVFDVDGMWVRPVHVPAFLGARSYALDLDVVLGVRDAMFGDAAFRLVASDGSAECVPTDAEPALTLDVASLGSIGLGGVRAQELAAAGLIAGAPDVIARVDRAFLGDSAPNHGTPF